MARRVLILFAHPAYERSRVNRALVQAIQGLEGVTFHDLYEACPDLHVDVRAEQRLLLDHDAIVFQHPFYWYSAPALVREWQDLVLEHGWAYGRGATALHGKATLNAVTTGGPAEAYAPGGWNRFTMRQLLAPFDQTAYLCGMRYLPPFVVHGSLRFPDAAAAAGEGARYRRALVALRDGLLDAAAVEQATVDAAAYLDDLLPRP